MEESCMRRLQFHHEVDVEEPPLSAASSMDSFVVEQPKLMTKAWQKFNSPMLERREGFLGPPVLVEGVGATNRVSLCFDEVEHASASEDGSHEGRPLSRTSLALPARLHPFAGVQPPTSASSATDQHTPPDIKRKSLAGSMDSTKSAAHVSHSATYASHSATSNSRSGPLVSCPSHQAPPNSTGPRTSAPLAIRIAGPNSIIPPARTYTPPPESPPHAFSPPRTTSVVGPPTLPPLPPVRPESRSPQDPAKLELSKSCHSSPRPKRWSLGAMLSRRGSQSDLVSHAAPPLANASEAQAGQPSAGNQKLWGSPKRSSSVPMPLQIAHSSSPHATQLKEATLHEDTIKEETIKEGSFKEAAFKEGSSRLRNSSSGIRRLWTGRGHSRSLSTNAVDGIAGGDYLLDGKLNLESGIETKTSLLSCFGGAPAGAVLQDGIVLMEAAGNSRHAADGHKNPEGGAKGKSNTANGIHTKEHSAAESSGRPSYDASSTPIPQVAAISEAEIQHALELLANTGHLSDDQRAEFKATLEKLNMSGADGSASEGSYPAAAEPPCEISDLGFQRSVLQSILLDIQPYHMGEPLEDGWFRRQLTLRSTDDSFDKPPEAAGKLLEAATSAATSTELATVSEAATGCETAAANDETHITQDTSAANGIQGGSSTDRARLAPIEEPPEKGGEKLAPVVGANSPHPGAARKVNSTPEAAVDEREEVAQAVEEVATSGERQPVGEAPPVPAASPPLTVTVRARYAHVDQVSVGAESACYCIALDVAQYLVSGVELDSHSLTYLIQSGGARWRAMCDDMSPEIAADGHVDFQLVMRHRKVRSRSSIHAGFDSSVDLLNGPQPLQLVHGIWELEEAYCQIGAGGVDDPSTTLQQYAKHAVAGAQAQSENEPAIAVYVMTCNDHTTVAAFHADGLVWQVNSLGRSLGPSCRLGHLLEFSNVSDFCRFYTHSNCPSTTESVQVEAHRIGSMPPEGAEVAFVAFTEPV
eukprot:gene17510-23824_t